MRNPESVSSRRQLLARGSGVALGLALGSSLSAVIEGTTSPTTQSKQSEQSLVISPAIATSSVPALASLFERFRPSLAESAPQAHVQERTAERRLELPSLAASSMISADVSRSTEVLASAKAVRAGRYFPKGVGLKAPLQKLVNAEWRLHRVSYAANVNKLLSGFGTARPDEGLCNGYSKYQAAETNTPPEEVNYGGEVFTRDDIDAIGSVLHYGDAYMTEAYAGRIFSLDELDAPILFHNIIQEGLGRQRKPVVINRSAVANQVWCNPVDRVEAVVTRLANGWVDVVARMDAGDYLEENRGEHREFIVHYQVNEEDITENGRFIGGTVPRMPYTYRPNWSLDGPNPDLEDYAIKGNVLTTPMIESYYKLAGYKPL